MDVGGRSRLLGECQLQLLLYNRSDQRERVFSNRAASANRQPGLRGAPAEAGACAHLHDASRRSGWIASVLQQDG